MTSPGRSKGMARKRSPEMTPSLARMVGAKANGMPKPIRWFAIGENYRYEKPQKGRLRAFYQLNADLLGEAGPAADAEIIALCADCLLGFGLTQSDFRIRVSDRTLWFRYLASLGIPEAQATAEGAPYDEEALLRLLRLARMGCDRIFAAQADAVK